MSVVVREADLTDAQVAAFLTSHVAQLRGMSPPESTHALDLDGLRDSALTVWVAYDDGCVVASAALKDLGDGHAELKSMRTSGDRQRRGLGRLMLDHVLEQARARGCTRLSLETGTEDFFAPARSLYRRAGFQECGPFGDYRPDPPSTFMTMSW
ncbi:GNAT family N-acetyltransferase [Aeromicrobium phragmitis]|uniref:GNAT family N-acetyltransferase n=1 Tax=Aeromicrobium phragmitis TaxID=2478914 RepID=A0A3L8PHK5_9ACTN|nr:GNAT family N-acetyltransferase [Aeromicrobium phragmitis]RLV54757.1 GNAT family N-acetyltransferase [Aeromicrobium phragmitis]